MTPYWKNNMGIRMVKHSYNTKLKEYRRHISPSNLEQVQAAYKEYTKLCTHVRNLSWNEWITDCNNNINSSEIWRRIKAAKGTAPTSHTHHMPKRHTHCVTTLHNDAHRKTYKIYTAATMTALRRGHKSRTTTIFQDLEKAFELVFLKSY